MTSSPSEERVVLEVTSVWFHVDDLMQYAYPDDTLRRYLQVGDKVWLHGSEDEFVIGTLRADDSFRCRPTNGDHYQSATIVDIERVCLTPELYTRLLFGCLLYLSKGGSTADEQTKQRIDYLVNLGAWLGFGKE